MLYKYLFFLTIFFIKKNGCCKINKINSYTNLNLCFIRVAVVVMMRQVHRHCKHKNCVTHTKTGPFFFFGSCTKKKVTVKILNNDVINPWVHKKTNREVQKEEAKGAQNYLLKPTYNPG